jgi:polyhydroxyalkanoate synthase
VLLVPSLINRHYVLDLMPGQELRRGSGGAGHDVFIIDWGTPGDEDRYLTFDDVCDATSAAPCASPRATAGREQAHVLGYCLGGTLTAIHAAARPGAYRLARALAAPVRFTTTGCSPAGPTPAFDSRRSCARPATCPGS